MHMHIHMSITRISQDPLAHADEAARMFSQRLAEQVSLRYKQQRLIVRQCTSQKQL